MNARHNQQIELTSTLCRDILEWDVRSWKKALLCWDAALSGAGGGRVLEVGARHGGLSLYFALRGFEVTCTDIDGPTENAHQLHERYGVADRITYGKNDATAMPFEDEQFDVVGCKSVLGGIGHDDNVAKIRQAIAEMHRVLRPGGMLLFAENLRASALHCWLRQRFVRWGRSWRYITHEELPGLFARFSRLDAAYYGFFAAFGKTEWQRTLLHGLDVLANPLISPRYRYIAYGRAIK